ncbi:protein LEG1 homolog [Aulostomus maculatus]
MLRPTGLCLLLACAVSLGSTAVVVENGMPILWAQTAAQIGDLPAQDGILTPDPWNFIHRMSLYRLMIASTDTYMGSMGPGPTDSPIWGLPLMHAWMLTSGRLADPTGATTCGLQTGDPTCISTQSWWGCIYYFLSALPFLSAAQQGFMGPGVQVQLQVPEGVEEYCTTYADCAARFAEPMAKWDAFFQGLTTMNDSPLPADEKKDTILGLYWDAQRASRIASSAPCTPKQALYSTPEATFTETWLNAAEYVTSARFHSNLDKSVLLLNPMPSRVLQEGDSPPNIADMTAEENRILSIYSWMNNMNTLLGGTMVGMWERAMCSVATREKGREMLEQLLLNPAYATTTFMSIITGWAGC